MVERRQVSPGRKLAFYGGYVCMVAGLVLWVTVFTSLFGKSASFSPSAIGYLTLRAALGLALLLLGRVLRRIGILGLAGSMVVLDPPKAKEDLEPWSRAAGGLVDAALSEVSALKRPAEPRAAAPGPTSVPCPRCQAPNEPGARFCGQCGGGLAPPSPSPG